MCPAGCIWPGLSGRGCPDRGEDGQKIFVGCSAICWAGAPEAATVSRITPGAGCLLMEWYPTKRQFQKGPFGGVDFCWTSGRPKSKGQFFD